MTSNARLLQRIKDTRDFVSDPFERRKLDYIATQITPEGLEKRDEHAQDVTHLHEVAASIIKRTGVPTDA